VLIEDYLIIFSDKKYIPRNLVLFLDKKYASKENGKNFEI